MDTRVKCTRIIPLILQENLREYIHSNFSDVYNEYLLEYLSESFWKMLASLCSKVSLFINLIQCKC